MRTLTVCIAFALAAAPAAQAQSIDLEQLGFSQKETRGSAEAQRVLDRRSRMLKTHQILGLATLAPMTATLFTGHGAAEGSGSSGRSLHAALGGTAGAMYFTTAGFSFFAPEPPEEKPARGATRIHKALAFIHFPAMIAAPILGAMAYEQRRKGESVHGAAKYHQTAAITGYAAFALAAATMTIKF